MSFYLLTAFIPTYHLNLAAGLSLRAHATINTGLSCFSLHPRPTVPDSVKLLEDENLPGLSLLMLKKAVSWKKLVRGLQAVQCAPLPAFHAGVGLGHAAAAFESHLFPQETSHLYSC